MKAGDWARLFPCYHRRMQAMAIAIRAKAHSVQKLEVL